MNRRTHKKNSEFVNRNIELRGIPEKKIQMSVCGRKIATLSTEEEEELDQYRGLVNTKEAKKAVFSYIIQNGEDEAVSRLLNVLDLEKTIAFLLEEEEFDKIENAKDFEFDNPEINERQYLQEVVETIIKPKGMKVVVRNKQKGIEATIMFRGLKTAI